MRSSIAIFLSLTLLPAAAWAATTAPAGSSGAPAPPGAGESHLQNIETLVVDDFENAFGWRGEMPRDQGLILARVIPFDDEGTDYDAQVFGISPLAWKSVNADKAQYPRVGPNRYCLGAKVAHMRSGWNWFTLVPGKPIRIPGVAKALTIWVCGRGYRHQLYGIIRDFHGTLLKFPFYTAEGHRPYMEFDGWQKMRMDIPSHIRQRQAHTSTDRGVTFVGLRVECHPRETFGRFYMYIDQLETETDMYDEAYRKKLLDMRDEW